MADELVVPLEQRRVNDTDLHGNPDAMAWAERFCEKYRAGVFEDGIDEGLMVTWFANAMAASYDNHPVEIEKQNEAVRAALGED